MMKKIRIIILDPKMAKRSGGQFDCSSEISEGFSAAVSAAFLACNFEYPAENQSQQETRQSNRIGPPDPGSWESESFQH